MGWYRDRRMRAEGARRKSRELPTWDSFNKLKAELDQLHQDGHGTIHAENLRKSIDILKAENDEMRLFITGLNTYVKTSEQSDAHFANDVRSMIARFIRNTEK